MTYGVIDAARGQERTNRPLIEDIQSASSDGTMIQVYFKVHSDNNELVYTAEAPDPEGPLKSEIPTLGSYEVKSLKNGCLQDGQKVDLYSATPKVGARGIYLYTFRFYYFSGNNKSVIINISEAHQFKTRVNARPAYYLTVPFTLVADIVVTPLWLLWMASCGSCK